MVTGWFHLKSYCKKDLNKSPISFHAKNASFKSVKSALSQFIWFLPDGLSLSIDTFSAEVHSIQPPAVLNYTIKNSILDMINTLPLDSQNTTSALVPALNHALEV